jgi:CheY-like chemotaxis protein
MPKWKNAALAHGLTITVKTDLSDIPPAQGDAAELREALINLIFNCVDAMPSGGVITMRSARTANTVRLEVSDTGTGMTEEIRQRCLEPYFTTKGKCGTGLGLAMVYAILHRHGGTVNIQSGLGRGTTFTLEIPVSAAKAEKRSETEQSLNRALRVLVVDDQPAFCHLVSEYLSFDRHTVETARNGREGLEKFRSGRYDLVLTDRAMPEMDGDQLAQAIRAVEPKQRIILLTGYEESSAIDIPRAEAIDCVLGKPLSMATLRKAMVEVMAQ